MNKDKKMTKLIIKEMQQKRLKIICKQTIKLEINSWNFKSDRDSTWTILVLQIFPQIILINQLTGTKGKLDRSQKPLQKRVLRWLLNGILLCARKILSPLHQKETGGILPRQGIPVRKMPKEIFRSLNQDLLQDNQL